MTELLIGSLVLMAVGAISLIASVSMQRRSGPGDRFGKARAVKFRLLGGAALLFGSFLPGLTLLRLVYPVASKYNLLIGSLALIAMGLLLSLLPDRTSRAAMAGWLPLAAGFLFLGYWFGILPAGLAEWLATPAHP